jgi:hypothetical protein
MIFFNNEMCHPFYLPTLVSKRNGQPVELTVAEARVELESIIAGVSVDTFQEVARARSDCISNTSGGDLGRFGPGKVPKRRGEGL